VSGPNHPRGTSNSNQRGGSAARAARRRWLVEVFGDGEFVDCALRAVPGCWVAMTEWSVWVDRILPGARGGTYERGNIRPACGPCQIHTGIWLREQLKAERAQVGA